MDSLTGKIKDFIFLHKIESALLGLSLFVFLSSLIMFGSLQTDVKAQSRTIIQRNNIDDHSLMVDIGGAVKKPGVYTVGSGQRIYELIDKAGGLSEDADLAFFDKTINRAQKLNDQAKIYIPFKNLGNVVTENISYAPTLISINSSSAEELESLTGVGTVTAKKIIDGRPYSTLDDLLKKKIIGSSVYEKIKLLITL